jgi:hypothetical protein
MYVFTVQLSGASALVLGRHSTEWRRCNPGSTFISKYLPDTSLTKLGLVIKVDKDIIIIIVITCIFTYYLLAYLVTYLHT